MIVPGMTNQEILMNLRNDFNKIKSDISKKKKRFISDMKRNGILSQKVSHSIHVFGKEKWSIWEYIDLKDPYKCYYDPICESESEKGTKDYYVLRGRSGNYGLIKYTSHSISRMRERNPGLFGNMKDAFEILHNITTPYELNPFGVANIKDLEEFIKTTYNDDEINGIVATSRGILLVKKEDNIMKVKTFFDFKTAVQTRNEGVVLYTIARFITLNKDLFDEEDVKRARDLQKMNGNNSILDAISALCPISPGFKKREKAIFIAGNSAIVGDKMLRKIKNQLQNG